jgi:Major capsid protein N-terminus
MVASLLKVIASGIQDERLDFKHTLYPFQKVWNKAGRFTTQWSRLDFENVPTFGNTAFLRLLRKGHLISRLFLVVTMPDIYTPQRQAYLANGNQYAFPQFGWTNSLGHALIDQLTLDIANARIDTLDSRLLEMLDEYNTPLEKVPIVNELIKRKDHGFNEKSFGWPPPVSNNSPLLSTQPYQETVIVPLPFWFSRGDPGCFLPIDAIPMDDIRIGITFRNLNGVYYTPTHLSSNTSNDDGTSLWPISGSYFYNVDPTTVSNPTPLPNVRMPINLQLGECYVMAEYIYLDQNEANRFRLSDLQIPMVQHYPMNPYDSRGLLNARIRLDIPNPTRDIFFMCNPYMASSYNAHFLATRDLSGNMNTLPNGTQTPWWPDALGLYANRPSLFLRPGFALSNSEPISGYAIEYQGSLVRFRTEGPALFRSVIPSYEQRKSPWINRYYYNFPLGIQNGYTPFSKPQGEANLDKITNRDLILRFRTSYANNSGVDVKRCIVYVWAETYNVLRVYGGRAGLLFAY